MAPKLPRRGSARPNSIIRKQAPAFFRSNNGFPVVGVGASAGGLEAFTELLRSLPKDPGLALVFIQHLAPKHQSVLSDLLGRSSPLPVTQATENVGVEKNHVYVIPPNALMSVRQGTLHLLPPEVGRVVQMPIDHFLRSLAEDQKECAAGVVLSGRGSDGCLELKAIKAEGGITFAQDETAQYDTMPRSAAAAGEVDFILPPRKIA